MYSPVSSGAPLRWCQASSRPMEHSKPGGQRASQGCAGAYWVAAARAQCIECYCCRHPPLAPHCPYCSFSRPRSTVAPLHALHRPAQLDSVTTRCVSPEQPAHARNHRRSRPSSGCSRAPMTRARSNRIRPETCPHLPAHRLGSSRGTRRGAQADRRGGGMASAGTLIGIGARRSGQLSCVTRCVDQSKLDGERCCTSTV